MADKITPKVLTSGFASIAALNENFSDIATELNDKVLYRNTSEPNQMENDFDMNSNRILNLPSPINNAEPARWIDVKNGVNTVDTPLPSLGGNQRRFLSSDGTALVFRKLSEVNVAAMTALLKAELIAGDTIRLDGYNTIDDEGGGWFSWDPASSATVDGGLIIASGEGGTGRWERILESTLTTAMFGTIRNGIANDSIPLKAFYDACIANDLEGFIVAGTYKIDRGVLVFDNDQIDQAWPVINTAGYDVVIFTTSDVTVAPMFKISNGDPGVVIENVWRGGKHGGVTFKDTSGSALTTNHAVSLRGIQSTFFEHIVGLNIAGDVLHIEKKNIAGNPDPFHVAFMTFGIVEGTDCTGWLVNNDNFVGFNFCTMGLLRAIRMGTGIYKGLGSSNTILNISAAACKGWVIDGAFDIGSNSRFFINQAELDNCEFGIRAESLRSFNFDNIRFVHRFNVGHTENVYFPKIAISLGSGPSPNVSNGRINVEHRIEPGGVKGDLGVFYEGNNDANVRAVTIQTLISDQASFGFVDSDTYDNIPATAFGTIINNKERQAFNNTIMVGCIVSGASVSVPNSGWSTIAAKIILPTEVYDRGNYYDITTGEFTVPHDGLYDFEGSLTYSTTVAGDRTRMAIAIDRASTVSILFQATHRAVTANNDETYAIARRVSLLKGDKVFLMIQKDGVASTLSSSTIQNGWSIKAAN